ncbi:MAG: hypothetical protein K6B68_02595 [Eubacterium sp.]|nr:hypothetical protein [Eubacterium sp.]
MRKNVKLTKRKMMTIAVAMSIMVAATTACGGSDNANNDVTEAVVTEAETTEAAETEAATEAETTEAAETEATTEEAKDENTASDTDGASAEVPNGDGLLSEEDVQKDYVWLDKIKGSMSFQLTYEDVKDRFGVDGKLDKEDSGDSGNKRYYKWISTEDDTHFIYINFTEKEAGKYMISSFNSSGFSSEEAADKYLSELESAAQEENKEAASNAETSSVTEDVYPFASKDDAIKMTFDLPTGWSYKNNSGKLKIVESEDVEAFGAGFIQVELKDSAEKLDTYIDSFENLADTDSREINGITMAGRTYSYIGYDWTEYYAELPDGKAISIGIVRTDVTEGTMGDNILKSLSW